MKNNKELAVHGGIPVRSTPLPWEFPGAHFIDEEELNLLMAVIRAKSPFRYYGLDLQHMVDNLEKEFKSQWQRAYALGVNSGTAALTIALSAMGVGPGDEVLVPGYMWVSCISAIVRLGAIPCLVDIDQTFCMDPIDLENKISHRSKVILFVHMSGASGYIDKVSNIARKHKLYLLEDCAQALGAKYHDKLVGTLGDIAIFSFQLNKNITSGEGGMLICDDELLYKRIFAIHDLGFPRDEAGRLITSQEQYQLWGIGSRMSELTGACVLAQLKKLPKIIKAMREAKWIIRKRLQDIHQLEFREVPDPKGDSGPFLITVYPDEKTCLNVAKALHAEGIQGHEGSLLCVPMTEWGLHWYFNISSLSQKRSWCGDGFPWTHPANQFAKDYSYKKGTLKSCDDLAARSLLLGIPSCLSNDDIEDICLAFQKVTSALL